MNTTKIVNKNINKFKEEGQPTTLINNNTKTETTNKINQDKKARDSATDNEIYPTANTNLASLNNNTKSNYRTFAWAKE